MCGVIGYQGPRVAVPKALLFGLQGVQSRGRDSWGVAALCDGNVEILRHLGTVPKAGTPQQSWRWTTKAIAHVRQATVGAVTVPNAHPLQDCTGRIAIVHNGWIDNYAQLRKDLQKRGHVFRGETDTEVIPHLVEEALSTQPGLDLAGALAAARTSMTGMLTVIALDASSGELAAMRDGTPLAVGISEGAVWLASTSGALAPYMSRTGKVMVIPDDTLVRIASDGGVSMENLPPALTNGGYHATAWYR